MVKKNPRLQYQFFSSNYETTQVLHTFLHLPPHTTWRWSEMSAWAHARRRSSTGWCGSAKAGVCICVTIHHAVLVCARTCTQTTKRATNHLMCITSTRFNYCCTSKGWDPPSYRLLLKIISMCIENTIKVFHFCYPHQKRDHRFLW